MAKLCLTVQVGQDKSCASCNYVFLHIVSRFLILAGGLLLMVIRHRWFEVCYFLYQEPYLWVASLSLDPAVAVTFVRLSSKIDFQGWFWSQLHFLQKVNISWVNRVEFFPQFLHSGKEMLHLRVCFLTNHFCRCRGFSRNINPICLYFYTVHRWHLNNFCANFFNVHSIIHFVLVLQDLLVSLLLN